MAIDEYEYVRKRKGEDGQYEDAYLSMVPVSSYLYLCMFTKCNAASHSVHYYYCKADCLRMTEQARTAVCILSDSQHETEEPNTF